MTGRARPDADPEFVDDLRSFLEDGVDDVVGPATADSGRLVVTKDRLTRALSCPVHRSADRGAGRVDDGLHGIVDGRPDGRSFSPALACGAMVGALFRQVVAVGAVDDPMDDALGALALDEHQAALVGWIRALPEAERSELRAEVARQALGLVERWPSFEPSWLPRTNETARVPIARGSVELRARVDFAVGRPDRNRASVALVDVVTGTRRPEHRAGRRFDALVETLRGPAPPFAVATYYSRTGELDVDPVDHDLLVAAARRTVRGARVLLGGDESLDDGSTCAVCRTLLRRPPVVVAVDVADPMGRDDAPAHPGSTVPVAPVVAFTAGVAA
jgi:hypothetical protein